MDARAIIDYAKSLDCIHCGLCLNTCPTYRLSGRETSSPRGRIHLMRSLAEGEIAADADFAEEMDFCLLCRNCESVCPSGVRFGALMEHTRAGLEPLRRRSLAGRAARALGFGVLRDRGLLALATRAASLADTLGLARLLGLPRLPARRERAYLPTHAPAEGERLLEVALLEGCVMPEIFGHVNRATAAVLARAGCAVRVAPSQGCCGSLHAHNGELGGARALARRTIEACEALVDERGEPLALLSNSAGCGSHLKEYEALFEPGDAWRERARALAARTLDLSELLAREPIRARLAARMRPTPGLAALGKVAWDDPCHLCHGQGVRRQPRLLLDLVPGLCRVELDLAESCCGSAGVYALTRPEDSRAVLAPKLEALRECGARTLVTSNPGCQMQWDAGVRAAGLEVRVLHLAEVLELATRA